LKLVVGLGNPGINYEMTRHNIGFYAVGIILQYLRVGMKPGKGEWYEAKVEHKGESFFLLKPTTYMNRSGTAVLEFTEKNGISLSDTLVVYDDFQLPLGTIRLRGKGSDGGHKGISSIIYEFGSLDFPRMRIGIGNNESVKMEKYTDFVLSKFSGDELKNLDIITPFIRDAILCFTTEGLLSAMNRYNRNFITPEKDIIEESEED